MGRALLLGLFFLMAALPAGAQVCTNDLQGPDDEPGQKDLNQFCANGSCGTGSSFSWNFDDTAWSGGNSGDSCMLFDTDNDGNANRAVCATVVGSVSLAPGSPTCYICADDRPTRCTNAMPVACTSSCTVALSSDPFPNPPTVTHTQCNGPNCLLQDARVNCCVQPADDGGVLLDVCSYPSQQPNSDPSDCIRQPDQCQSNADCNDDNPCTVDTCVSAPGPDFCRNTPGNAGSVCRASSGDACDAAETCTGTTATCPADVPAPAGTVCRAASGVCDVQEVCTGLGNACPTDVKAPGGTACTDDGNVCTTDQCGGTPLSGNGVCEHPAGNAGTICRADSGQCDVAETCTGTSPACPADAFEPASAACVGSSQGGVCDAPDHCSGTSAACVDTYQPSTVECRPGTGQCDVAETCTGTSGACPADAFAPAGSACGDSSDTACDNPDTCNGSGACQANNEPTTTVCRPDAGDCDVAETCAPGGVCPADAFELPGTACGSPSDTVCDNPDTCNGSGTCQANNEPPTTVCRPGDGVCDVAETCAPGGVCPADAFAPATTPCTGASQGGACDAPDHCSGTSTACVDEFQPSTVECRPDTGQCDVAENCTGTSGACPADRFEPQTATCTGTSQGGACDATDHCSGTSTACVDEFQPSSFECRADTGQCDVAENCTGTSGACPADTFEPATVTCTGASQGGACDATDHCSGTSTGCVDEFQPSTVECRADTGQCDVAESCTGTSGACPADRFEPATVTCTGASQGGVCDAADHCSGTSTACVDEFQPSSFECRADTGQCDVAERCTGTSGACPADSFEPATVTCTGASQGGVCDAADHCSGTSTACVDEFQPSSFECRADTGQCDVAERCTGTSGACPADSFEPATATCTGASQGGACDAADHCSGTSTACVDVFRPSSFECRADAGQCDVAERCTGTSGACPADAFEPSTTGCTGTSQGGACDAADHCSGIGNTCVDVYSAATVVCRPDAGECDVEERCTGTSGACPGDVLEPAGTACGSGSDTECDNPNTCDGQGNCQANNEPPGTPCSEGDVCTSPDACDQHGQCAPGPVVGGCKVTGGGQLLASGSFPWISFGFNAQTGGGSVKGQLELNRHSAPQASYHSLQVQTLAITPIAQCTANPSLSGQKATFTGTIRRKGQSEPCEFEVVVEDCGEPGRYDYFSIDIQGPALCPESRSGVLDRGNIQVH